MMLLFIVFCPLIAAVLILAGAPARTTALARSAATADAPRCSHFSASIEPRGLQLVPSFPISAEWRLNFSPRPGRLEPDHGFATGARHAGGDLVHAAEIEKSRARFYACLLFIAGGAIGAFASLDLFFFYAFHELALIPTFLLIGIWGSGNRSAAAWKITIYLATGSFILLLGLILLYRSVPEGGAQL